MTGRIPSLRLYDLQGEESQTCDPAGMEDTQTQRGAHACALWMSHACMATHIQPNIGQRVIINNFTNRKWDELHLLESDARGSGQ